MPCAFCQCLNWKPLLGTQYGSRKRRKPSKYVIVSTHEASWLIMFKHPKSSNESNKCWLLLKAKTNTNHCKETIKIETGRFRGVSKYIYIYISWQIFATLYMHISTLLHTCIYIYMSIYMHTCVLLYTCSPWSVCKPIWCHFHSFPPRCCRGLVWQQAAVAMREGQHWRIQVLRGSWA